jgi:hypothetical protein
LLYANGLNFIEKGRLLSTAQVAAHGSKSLAGLAHLLTEYLSLGDGALVRCFILGDDHGLAVVEAVLLSIALLAVLVSTQDRSNGRSAMSLIVCYFAVVVGLYLLPNNTGSHHWVIGTPFQYLALAMAIGPLGLPALRWAGPAKLGRAALLSAVVLLIFVRTHGSLDLARALARGASSPTWDSSLTRLGELAAQRAGQDHFVAGSWGVANQIYCLSNGHPEVVTEVLQWPPYPPLEQSLDLDRFRAIYLVLKVPQAFPSPDVTKRLIDTFDEHPDLREVPAEAELASLDGIKIRKFVRGRAVTNR